MFNVNPVVTNSSEVKRILEERKGIALLHSTMAEMLVQPLVAVPLAWLCIPAHTVFVGGKPVRDHVLVAGLGSPAGCSVNLTKLLALCSSSSSFCLRPSQDKSGISSDKDALQHNGNTKLRRKLTNKRMKRKPEDSLQE